MKATGVETEEKKQGRELKIAPVQLPEEVKEAVSHEMVRLQEEIDKGEEQARNVKRKITTAQKKMVELRNWLEGQEA